MPDHTAISAAEYLAAHGYEVPRGRIGGRGPPSADTVRRWCTYGKIEARRIGYIWLISQAALDALIAAQRGTQEKDMATPAEYADILAMVVENGRWTSGDLDELEVEVDFEARERGLSEDEIKEAVAYARSHIKA